MNNKDKSNFPSIPLIIFGYVIWWPIGLILTLYKVGVFDALKSALGGSSRSFDAQESARLSKYRLMAQGAQALSIEHMASAVGISYESCLRDVQKMVAEGEFGSSAYINYIDRTLVLTAPSASGYTASKTVQSTDWRAQAVKNERQNYERQQQQKRRESELERRKSQKSAKPYGSAPTWLLIAGIILAIISLGSIGDFLDGAVYNFFDFSGLTFALSAAAGSVASFLTAGSLRRRANRMATYAAAIAGHDYYWLTDLAGLTGVKEKTLLRDLEVMIDKGMLGESAFIDKGSKLLILKPGAGPEKEAEPEVPEDGEDRYRAILREIRQVNDDIPDPDISRKIDEMEDLTSKIFAAVQEKPEKLPQIKSFMSYYLPTALKLLHSYAEFDSSGVKGDNIKSAKADIERILDMLVEGFRKQLDKLYEAEAMDISSDIDVLETMLRKDGLSSDGSNFGMTAGGR